MNAEDFEERQPWEGCGEAWKHAPDWLDVQMKVASCCGCGRTCELQSFEWNDKTWERLPLGWTEFFGPGHGPENEFPLCLCSQCKLEWLPLPQPVAPPRLAHLPVTIKYALKMAHKQ